jgi:hypothetical protein
MKEVVVVTIVNATGEEVVEVAERKPTTEIEENLLDGMIFLLLNPGIFYLLFYFRGRGVDRGGRGPYNWGNPAEDSRLAEKNPDLANPDSEVVDENEGKQVEVEDSEPPVPQLTYEDYLAQRNQARANQEIFGAVKERSVEKDLAGIQIKDADDLTDFMVLGEGKSNKSKASREQRSAALAKQMLLDVGFKNAALESNRDRDDDRGNRNGGKDKRSGGRSKGSPTSRSSGGAKIDISDTSAFPSL